MRYSRVHIRPAVGLLALVGLLPCSLFADAAADAKRQAASILAASEVRGGLLVHLACGDGALTAELGARERVLVEGLDTDASNVAQARERLVKLGLHGKVTARRYDGTSLPYADNTAALVVWTKPTGVSTGEVMRVLRPGGVACWLDAAKAAGGGEGGWRKTVKPWPNDMDEWTHFLHGPDGNAVARDRRVGQPEHVQWMAGPTWARHHDLVPSVNAVVSAGGRMYYMVDDAPACIAGPVGDQWSLAARDAFSGVLLWKRPLPQPKWGWKAWSGVWKARFNEPNHVPKRLVAVGDRLFVTLGFNAPLSELDGATGRVLRTFKGTDYTDEILYHKNKLILSVNHGPQKAGTVADNPPVKKSVLALDPTDGKVLWKTGSYVGTSSKTGTVERVTHLSLAACGGGVYLADKNAIVGLDLASGKQRWTAPRPVHKRYTSRYNHLMNDLCTLVATDDVVLFAQLEPIQKRIGWGVIKTGLYAFSTRDGHMVWSRVIGNWGHFCVPDVFVIDGLAWVHDYKTVAMVGLDLRTGEVKRSISTKPWFQQGHHHRCYRNKATEKYILTGYRGAEYIDLESGTVTPHHWTRGGCRFGILPCNGLLYATPHPCQCYIKAKLNGFYAMAPAQPSDAGAPKDRATPRAEKGPAFGKVPGAGNPQSAIRNPEGTVGPQSEDWPTYRHDVARGGTTATCVGRTPKPVWTAKIGGRVSPPVVADGMLLVSAVDDCVVYAIDAQTGKPKWHYAAGGRVDSPPTICGGMALFGCADGWLYALRLADGEEVWRVRVAPAERRIVSFNRLESAWPAHGSVLVKEGVAYVTAGRSSYVDGGIYAYSVRVKDGKILSRKRIYSPDPKTGLQPPQTGPQGLAGALSDILVAGDAGVTMRQMRIDGDAAPQEVLKGHPRQLQCTGGFLDDTWFNRIKWSYGTAWGQLLSIDEKTVYGVRAYPVASRFPFLAVGKGYNLFAADPLAKRSKPKRSKPRGADRWSIRVGIRPRAMVLAGPTAKSGQGRTLFVAGCPDVMDADDPWAAFEGRKGGSLWAIGAKDGQKLAEVPLASPPVFDGLIAAHGRLYLSTVAGTVVCLGAGR